MIAVDANVWVYYLDGDLPEHDPVVASLDEILGTEPLFVNTAIQMEVIHYVSRQVDEFESVVTPFLELDGVTVADLTSQDVAEAVAYLAEHRELGVGGRDASFIAAMDRYGVTELWTHDGDLKRLGDRLDWLAIGDPAA